jgi:hypothetical protein
VRQVIVGRHAINSLPASRDGRAGLVVVYRGYGDNPSPNLLLNRAADHDRSAEL